MSALSARHGFLPLLAGACLLLLPLRSEKDGARESQAVARAQEAATICAIQGSGEASPMLDAQVRVEGYVSADLVETALDGFFLQEPDCDGDPATSDGIWVFDGNRDLAVETGQRLAVSGRVDEYYGLTEIVLDRLEVLSGTLPSQPVARLDLPQSPIAAASYLEAHEGMLVDGGALRIVGPTNHFGEAYGVTADSGIQRLFRGDADGRRLGLVFPKGWQRLDFGDEVTGAIGPLGYSFENFKVIVTRTEGMDRSSDPERVEARAEPAGAGELTVASFNVENLFDTVDDPDKNDTEWTLSPEQYAIALARRARVIDRNLGRPDIIAFQEVENLGVLEDLAARPELAGAGYRAILVDGPDARGIDVGYLYRADRLRLVEARSAQACTPMQVPEPDLACSMGGGGEGWELFSRPPLIARFEWRATGGRISLIANHFKSKRGGDEVTTPIREAMADHVLGLVAGLRAAEPATPVLVMGDLNDFEDSTPIARLTVDPGGLHNLWLDPAIVAAEDRFSYVFNGVSQILDFILPTPGLEILSFGALHLNSVYGSDAPDDEAGQSPHSSDHDPLLLRLSIDALPAPQPTLYLPFLARQYDAGVADGTPATAESTRPASPVPTRSSTAAPSAQPTAAPTVGPSPTSVAGAPPASPIRIEALFFDGEEPQFEGDEHIDFSNVGAGEVDLSGWSIVSVRGPQTYYFPDGFAMQPGQHCRVYTDELHAEHCGLNWESGDQAIWRNAGDKAEIRDASGALIDWFCYGDFAGECGG